MKPATLTAITIAIAGIAAWIVPPFANAVNRSRQKKTMERMRNWAAYLEAYPDVKKHPALNDAWGHRFRVVYSPSSYTITSLGRDGIAEPKITLGLGITSFDCDIVYSDGSFIQWPEGI
jgi:Tfp pilus assembly protein PilE